jgi:hypothetical protein
MKCLVPALLLCLLFCAVAQADESWVFFHSDKEYFFEAPNKGVPLKPLYQRETYYYDKYSLKISGFLMWKTVSAGVKMESWGVYNNRESIARWEVYCKKRIVRKYDKGGSRASSVTVDSGDEAAKAFYRAVCY